MKNIQEYLPVKIKRDQLIQARIPEELFLEVKKLMKSKHLNWSDVITACLLHLVDEKKEGTPYDSD